MSFGGQILETDDRHAVTVVMVSGGYPGNYKKGFPVSGLDATKECVVFMPVQVLMSKQQALKPVEDACLHLQHWIIQSKVHEKLSIKISVKYNFRLPLIGRILVKT